MSYGEVNVDIILNACSDYLQDRENYIRQIQEKEIQNKMKPRKILGFTFCGMTREQAIENLKADDWSTYNTIEFYGGRQAYRVEMLKSLCLVPGVVKIQLSVEDAKILNDFF